MEGGTKIKIPLDSGLDVHSSDMLVSVQEPKFQHNRQKYQGKYMPSSLRFEHDGWAAGWDVYQFKFTEGCVETTPKAFTVSKQKIYNNPTYKLSMKNSNDKVIGSTYYTPSSKIINTTAENIKVSSGANPVITGKINDKDFTLTFDSLNMSNNPVLSGDSNITFNGVGFMLSSDYVATIQLQDNTVKVDLTFDGMTAPADIKNGDYTIGQFVALSNSKAVWQQGYFNLSLQNDNLTISYNGVELKTVPVTNNFNADSTYKNTTASFQLPLTFTDLPSCSVTEFFPFFINFAAFATTNTVSSKASDSLPFNKWTCSVEDKQGGIFQDKLYRNYASRGDLPDSYNKQTIIQDIPVWFGMYAEAGFIYDTEGASPVDNIGDILSSGDELYADQHLWTYEIKTTADVRKYNKPLYRPNIKIFEHCYDATDRYDITENFYGVVSIGVRVDIDVQYDTSVFGSDTILHRNRTISFYLPITYSNRLNKDKLLNMLYIHKVNIYTEIKSKKITVSDTQRFIIHGGWLNTPIFVFSSNDMVEMQIVGAAQSGEPISHACAGYIELSNSAGDYMSQLSGKTAFWGTACIGHVASDLYIKEDAGTITQSNIANIFVLKKSTTVNRLTTDLWLDDEDTGSNYFTHKLQYAAYMSELNISVALCATRNKMYMFYGNTNDGAQEVLSYCPGHIMSGDIKKIKSTDGNINAYILQKNYSSISNDPDYSLTLTISAQSVKDEDDNLFNYVSPKSMLSIFDNSSLILGNKFSEEVYNNLINSVSFDIGDWQGQFDTTATDDYDSAALLINRKQLLTFKHADEDMFTIMYTLDNSENNVTLLNDTYSISGYIIKVELGTATDFNKDTMKKIQNLSIKHTVEQSNNNNYNISFKRLWLKRNTDMYGLQSARMKVLSFENNILLLQDMQDNTRQYKIDYIQLQCYVSFNGGKSFIECSETFGDSYYCKFSSIDSRIIVASLFGVYNSKDITVTGLTPSVLKFNYNGTEYSVDITSSGLFDSNKKSVMDFCFTDTRKPVLEQKHIQRVNTEDELQFIKQQWDTDVSTENFWWVDNAHVLALLKDKFVLRVKTEELDDWNGNKFNDEVVFDKIEYITSDIKQYFCTNAYAGETARFVTISSNSTIQVHVYDPLDNMSVKSFSVPLVKRNIGELLRANDLVMQTYSDIIVSNLVSEAKFTATIISGILLLGIHFDNNMNQWTVPFDLNTGKIKPIVHGYGFVGLDGSLTGGEIPSKYCDKLGFNGTVQDMSVLSDTSVDISDLSTLSVLGNKIVGTPEQQWYISKNIPSIISHFTYSNGEFIAVELPLNNNYSVKYESASFYSSVFSDYEFKIKSLKELVPGSANAAWTTMLALFTWPLMYYLSPKISVANYLQQTLGQAAYVHYNSTSTRQQKDQTKDNSITNDIGIDTVNNDAISFDEISFDRQSVKQSASCDSPYNSLLSMCAAALVSATDMLPTGLTVNQYQNQIAASDIGKKYTQNFLQNINSLAVSDIQLAAVNPTLNSEVTAVKTLDMFYSTSDKQQIQAGPGYVNHNFVAQCVAQSVTSVQAEISQQKLLYAITSLTKYQLEITHGIAKAAVEALRAQLDSVSGPSIVGAGMTIIGTVSTPLAIGYAVAYAAANALLYTTKVALDNIPTIINALTGGKLNSTITGKLTKHAYDIEGKHKYGSKSEVFMWPCFGCNQQQQITDESVEVVTQNKSWKLGLSTGSPRNVISSKVPSFVTQNVPSSVSEQFDGQVPYYIAMLKGKQTKVTLPDNMAYVIGADTFLPSIDFKNENIGESEPVFPTAPFQDYVIDAQWQLSRTASVGMTTWVSCKDTKLIDGEPSNMVVSTDFCGIASPYCAIEVRHGIIKDYLRPWAITPQALALNNSGFNCCYDEKAYHAFDGYGQRIISWLGSSGMSKNHQTWQYAFLRNDRFKRSNKLPQNEFLGNFKADPTLAIDALGEDKIYSLITQPGEGRGLEAGTIGEDKDVHRYAVPVFSEFVSTLPAVVKTISSYSLTVVDGVTSLTSENRDLQSAYKSPISIDFAIGKNKYRFTNEYICSLQQNNGVTVLQELVPCLGLTFLGATPYEAYLYSQATRQYYQFTGGSSLSAVDMIERFRAVINGRYDFVNQEVVMPCLVTFVRLDKNVLDDEDETDNVIVPRLKGGQFIGELPPPLETIYKTSSWFRTISLPSGIVYQGPNRCIINRFVFSDYMQQQIKANYGLWKRVHREDYHPFRKYKAQYEHVNVDIGNNVQLPVPKGWTHNPFLLVTSPLGIANEVDCLFEWEVTFAWPVEMDKLYGIDNYATVMLQAETMTPGGKVIADRPVHIYLTKELFTRTGNYGYYSFRYQSKCGAGNRERLHIWSDQYICISALQVEYKEVTTKRTEQLTQQIDIQSLKEI